jgi:hypothetical protein
MELTEAGWKILDLKVSLNYVIDEYISCEVDRMVTACPPENAAFRVRPISTVDDIMKRMSFLNEICNGDDVAGITRTRKYMRENAESPHGGDCLKQPCTCTRCYIEGFLGIDTLRITGFSMGPATDIMKQYFQTKKIYEICGSVYDAFVMKEQKLSEVQAKATGTFRDYLTDYKNHLYGRAFHASIPLTF